MVTSGVSLSRVLVGQHRGDVTACVAVMRSGASLASSVGWCETTIRFGGDHPLPAGAELASTQTPQVNRLAVRAWVLANTTTRHVEVWTAELCPAHNPPDPSANGCGESDQPHRSHQVPGCSCWCTGTSTARFDLAVSVPAVSSLEAAVSSIEASPFPNQTPLASVVESLLLVQGEAVEVVEIWASLVAQGMDPYRAQRAAAVLSGSHTTR